MAEKNNVRKGLSADPMDLTNAIFFDVAVGRRFAGIVDLKSEYIAGNTT
jgi:hypothetical protein